MASRSWLRMRLLLTCSSAYAPTTPLFLEALEELANENGHEWTFFDEARWANPGWSLLHKVAYRLLHRRPPGYWAMNRALLATARRFRPDVVLVVKGAFYSPATLERVKRNTGAILVNYATDDPFNRRVSTADLVRAIPLYDLYVCTKRAIIPDIGKAGCPRVVYLPFGYKPSLHFPEKPAIGEEQARFCSDVIFVGTCDEDRGLYFEALIKAIPGLRLSLYGGYWNRHPILKAYHRGFALGRDYRLALGGAKIALNFVRKANRDGHVMRTFEIPACGAFMLAERTEEHLELLSEGAEVEYFATVEECVEKVRYYLGRETDRRRIAEVGYLKVTQGAHTYKDRLAQILGIVETAVSAG